MAPKELRVNDLSWGDSTEYVCTACSMHFASVQELEEHRKKMHAVQQGV